MKYDYTWRCDCDAEGYETSLLLSRKEARKHLKECLVDNSKIFIDQYDLAGSELSAKFWVLTK